jgi:hypothetical protein
MMNKDFCTLTKDGRLLYNQKEVCPSKVWSYPIKLSTGVLWDSLIESIRKNKNVLEALTASFSEYSISDLLDEFEDITLEYYGVEDSIDAIVFKTLASTYMSESGNSMFLDIQKYIYGRSKDKSSDKIYIGMYSPVRFLGIPLIIDTKVNIKDTNSITSEHEYFIHFKVSDLYEAFLTEMTISGVGIEREFNRLKTSSNIRKVKLGILTINDLL